MWAARSWRRRARRPTSRPSGGAGGRQPNYSRLTLAQRRGIAQDLRAGLPQPADV
jgi:hypothetical protein